MPGYEYRLSGIPIQSFGRDVDTFRENDLAEAIQANIGELAYRTGHTSDPHLKLDGSFAVVIGRDNRDGQLVIGFNPEFLVSIGNIEGAPVDESVSDS